MRSIHASRWGRPPPATTTDNRHQASSTGQQKVSPSRLCCVSTRTPSRAPPIRTRTSPTAAFAWTSCSSPARPSLDRETSPASFSGWRQAGAGRNSSSRQRRQPKDPLTLLTPSGRRPRHRWQLPGCCLSGSWPGYERASPFLA